MKIISTSGLIRELRIPHKNTVKVYSSLKFVSLNLIYQFEANLMQNLQTKNIEITSNENVKMGQPKNKEFFKRKCKFTLIPNE